MEDMRTPTPQPSMAGKVIGTVVVSAIVFGGLGYYLGSMNEQENDGIQYATVAPTPSDTSVPVVKASPSAETMKTYTNTKYKFSLKHPSDWITEEGTGTNATPSVVSLTSPETDKNNKSPKSGNPGCEGCGPDIDIYYHASVADLPQQVGSVPAKTLDEYFTKQSAMIKKTGTTTLGGVQAIEVTEGGAGAYYVIYVQKGDAVYRIFFEKMETSAGLSAEEKQILSSFTFTN